MIKTIKTELTEESKSTVEDVGIRPQSFDEYIGQSKIKNNIRVYIKAAKERQDVLDHILLYGPPGLGKTTLANIISNEMEAQIKTTSGPAIEKPGELAAILSSLQEGDFLFIDEIHRLNRQTEEVLYSAMEDYFISIMIGEGPQAKSIKLTLPKFTLIGATTRVGLLSAPLRDRFGIVEKLEYYSTKELSDILKRSAGVLDIKINRQGQKAIAEASKGTPRIANRILKRVRDFAWNQSSELIDKEIAESSLNFLGIDSYGLNLVELGLLKSIKDKYNGGPVGVDTIAAITGEDTATIENVYEPFLLKNGFIDKTPRGRVLTEFCIEYLEKKGN